MWQLLTAARRMHGCHVVHRDIKPANIIVAAGEGGQGVLKICDFGVALSLAEAPSYKDEGTRWYRAPEMLLGSRDYDALVDTWSLGCVMAEILTGERLFNADGPISQLSRIFKVVGAPDDTTWPGFTSRQFAAEVQEVLTGQRSTLREMFPEEKLSKEGFDVLSAQRPSYLQPRQAAHGGRRAQAPLVRYLCCKCKRSHSSCSCYEGGVRKGGGSGDCSIIDAAQKEGHREENVVRDWEEGRADR